MASEQLVLALNAGSSSLKGAVIKGEETLVSFLGERLTTADAVIYAKPEGQKKVIFEKEAGKVVDHTGALTLIIEYLEKNSMLADLVAVGHRLVHGSVLFSDSAVVSDEMLATVATFNHLAPLHNPANLAGIDAMRKLLPNIPNVAVFDTSFHSTMPEKAYTYPLPKEYRDQQIRKFGFHGTSVRYVSAKTTEYLRKVKGDENKDFNIMVCHLGNGASLTAVSENKSMDTTMGFTPLPGLMMGTRCGDVDPSIAAFAIDHLNKDISQVMNDFNKNSGLKAMFEDGTNDMRVVLQRAGEGDAEGKLCLDMFVYRLAQHMAMYLVALTGPLDSIVFTAGIGENAPEIRRRSCEEMAKIYPNMVIDEERNNCHGANSDGVITKEGSWPVVMVVPTDEEAMIASECIRLVK